MINNGRSTPLDSFIQRSYTTTDKKLSVKVTFTRFYIKKSSDVSYCAYDYIDGCFFVYDDVAKTNYQVYTAVDADKLFFQSSNVFLYRSNHL
jgi:hypothetical protein